MRVSAAAAVLLLLVAACGGAANDPVDSIPAGAGAESAIAAVEELVSALDGADFTGASHLAVPKQAALASLAEGATFGEVAEALRTGDEEVAANFWAGFAQGAGNYLVGPLDLAEGGEVSRDGATFQTVTVTPESGGSRTVLVRDVDGHRIDLFASFGAGLADKMIPPVERLLGAQTPDARLILTELQSVVPSLLVSAELPGTPSDVAQEILALVEVITRVS